jgi:hypothetical protein
MRKAIAVALLAAGAALTAGTAPAQAEADFNAFIADLQRAGITYSTPSAAIDFGLHVCNAIRSGESPAQVFARVHSFGIGPEQGGPLVAISVDDLCPDQRANFDNQVRSMQAG